MTFSYVSSFSMIFQTWKISTLLHWQAIPYTGVTVRDAKVVELEYMSVKTFVLKKTCTTLLIKTLNFNGYSYSHATSL